MGNIIKTKRVITSHSSTSSGGGGTDPADKARITNLENNEYKIIYWEAVNSNAGTITKPTNSTILLDSFQQGIDAVVETIIGGQPSGFSPITSTGAYVTVSSFDTSGNFVLSGIPSSYSVAIVYIIKIKALDYVNVNNSFVLSSESLLNSAKGNIIVASAAAGSPADGVTYFIGAYYTLSYTSVVPANGKRIYINKTGTITFATLSLWCSTAFGSTENISFYVRINDTTDYAITLTAQADQTRSYNLTGLNIPVLAGDWIVIKMVCPTWVTNPLNLFIFCTLNLE